MIRIREAAVAGSFYPADPGELQSMVHRMLDAVAPRAGPPPKALIVPHAGYVYSGAVAAAAYARLRPYQAQYRRVVLLGPGHCVAFRGLAASSADAFRTPLGDVPVDHAALGALPGDVVSVIDAAHRPEHSLEVQLPFLQSVLADFELLPLLVGDARAAEVAAMIDRLWGGPETLLVVSSDLSHYLPYERAREVDRLQRYRGARPCRHRHRAGLRRGSAARIADRRRRPRLADPDAGFAQLRRHFGRPGSGRRLRRLAAGGG
jgi:AmmeMemoRadiSam system protein B